MESREHAAWSRWRSARDPAAFEALVVPQLGCALGVARAVGCSREDAEDAVQDALTRLAEERGDEPSRVGVRAWFLRLVRDRARGRVRSRHRRRTREAAVARPEHHEPRSDVELREQVERALDELDESDREAVRLRFLLDLDYREMAIVQRTAEATCRVRVHRALERLKKRLGGGAATLVASLARPSPANGSTLVARALTRSAMAARTTTISAGLGVLAMSTATKIGIGGIATMAFSVVVWLVLDVGTPEPLVTDPGRREDQRTDAMPAGANRNPADASTPGEVAPPRVVRLSGRVIDERRHPVAGVSVHLWDNAPASTATTDSAGRFHFDVARPEPPMYRSAGLYARAADGRVATATAAIGVVDRDVDELVLAVGHEVAVEVLDDAGPVASARVVAFHRSPIDGVGAVPAVEATTDPHGRATVRLSPGRAALDVSAGDRRGECDTRVPTRDGDPVVVRLGPTRDVEVTVVEVGTDAPIPGAIVEVYRLRRWPRFERRDRYLPLRDPPPSDDDGRTVIRGLFPSDRLLLDVKAPGRPPHESIGPWLLVKSGVTSIRAELGAPRTYRWPVVAGESPVPPDGATIALTPELNAGITWIPTTARMEGDHLVTNGFGRYALAIATAPDGSMARLFGLLDQDCPVVSFRPARTVDVFVRDAEGRPVQGVFVALRNQGNVPITRPCLSDEGARVRFDGLFERLVDVAAGTDSIGFGGVVGPSVDLEAGSGSVVVALGREVTVTLHLTIDGEPRLPPRYEVIDARHTPLTDVLEDPGSGELRARTFIDEDEESVRLLLTAPGFANVALDVRPGLASTVDRNVELARAGALDVTLIGESRSIVVVLDRWDADREAWERLNVQTADLGPDAFQFGGLRPGRYRVLEANTRIVSEPVDVMAASAPAVTTLDLTAQATIEGRVGVPSGFDANLARVIVEGLVPGAAPERVRGRPFNISAPVAGSGRFRLSVETGRTVRLRATHPLLRPDPTAPSVAVDAPAHSVVLRLIVGGTGRLELDPDPRIDPVAFRQPRVLYFDGTPSATDPIAESRLVSRDSHHELGGVEPGRYTLWLDVPGFAPVTLRDVVLGKEAIDLGRVELRRGSGVRVNVLVDDGEAVPRVNVSATALDGPRYTRWFDGSRDIVLRGLGPGRFRVTARPTMGAERGGVSEIVTVDGSNTTEVEVVLDLRRRR